jgi:hypothetical protein
VFPCKGTANGDRGAEEGKEEARHLKIAAIKLIKKQKRNNRSRHWNWQARGRGHNRECKWLRWTLSSSGWTGSITPEYAPLDFVPHSSLQFIYFIFILLKITIYVDGVPLIYHLRASFLFQFYDHLI